MDCVMNKLMGFCASFELMQANLEHKKFLNDWWDESDDTAFQINDSKLELWQSEADHATSRSHTLPAI